MIIVDNCSLVADSVLQWNAIDAVNHFQVFFKAELNMLQTLTACYVIYTLNWLKLESL